MLCFEEYRSIKTKKNVQESQIQKTIWDEDLFEIFLIAIADFRHKIKSLEKILRLMGIKYHNHFP